MLRRVLLSFLVTGFFSQGLFSEQRDTILTVEGTIEFVGRELPEGWSGTIGPAVEALPLVVQIRLAETSVVLLDGATFLRIRIHDERDQLGEGLQLGQSIEFEIPSFRNFIWKCSHSEPSHTALTKERRDELKVAYGCTAWTLILN